MTARRIAGSLSVLFEAAAAGDSIASSGIEARDPWTLVQWSIFVRSINALKAARPLIVELHWEFAAGPARQLFELLVNVEYIVAQDDPVIAATKFARFGMLQTLLGQLESYRYTEQTGRPVDPGHKARLIELLTDFDDLRQGRNSDRWPTNWSGKSTRELAELSMRQPLRQAQYLQLFSAWSEQVHAAPSALMPNMFPLINPTMSELLNQDLTRASEVAAMTATLYMELWRSLPAIPGPALSQALNWTKALMTEAQTLGAPAPLAS